MNKSKLIKWKINTYNKTISYNKATFLDKIKGFFGFPKFTVNEFYCYLDDEFVKPDRSSFDIPIDAEGVKDSSISYPRYWLMNSWTINKKDLKHLIKGPLISEDGRKILVDKTPFLKTAWGIIKALSIIFGLIAAIVTIIMLVLRLV